MAERFSTFIRESSPRADPMGKHLDRARESHFGGCSSEGPVGTRSDCVSKQVALNDLVQKNEVSERVSESF